jgi:hypothetical protein
LSTDFKKEILSDFSNKEKADEEVGLGEVGFFERLAFDSPSQAVLGMTGGEKTPISSGVSTLMKQT